jgi:hypothetical protein
LSPSQSGCAAGEGGEHPNMIVFSGNRGGLADADRIASCIAG